MECYRNAIGIPSAVRIPKACCQQPDGCLEVCCDGTNCGRLADRIDARRISFVQER